MILDSSICVICMSHAYNGNSFMMFMEYVNQKLTLVYAHDKEYCI